MADLMADWRMGGGVAEVSSVKTRGLDFEPGGLPLRGGVAGVAGTSGTSGSSAATAAATHGLKDGSPRADCCCLALLLADRCRC